MALQSCHPNNQGQIIRELVGMIEALREQRRAAYADVRHPQLKRFTQEELADSCCPSYKNLLYGYTQRLPSRLQIVQIADYLECTIHERNDLLLAAQYLPDPIELRDDQYQAALDHAQYILHLLPFPAYIILSEWIIGAANKYFLTMTGLSHIEQIPRSQCTPVHTVFDKTLPFRHVLELDPEVYAANASLGIAIFSTHNQRYQRERWFQISIEQYRCLPDFSTYWNARGRPILERNIVDTYTVVHQATGMVMDIRPILIPVTFAPYPIIHAFVPANAAAHAAMAQLDAPTPENRWEQALSAGKLFFEGR